MKQRILVTYATRGRSTQSIAQAIAEELVKLGGVVDMRFLLDVSDLIPYEAIIIGSSVRAGRWLPEAVQFVKIHQTLLQQKSVAYFVACMTLRKDTPENRARILTALEPVCNLVNPVDIGLFAGSLERKRLKLMWRLMSILLRFPEGDFRDFTAIRTWAIQLAEKL